MGINHHFLNFFCYLHYKFLIKDKDCVLIFSVFCYCYNVSFRHRENILLINELTFPKVRSLVTCRDESEGFQVLIITYISSSRGMEYCRLLSFYMPLIIFYSLFLLTPLFLNQIWQIFIMWLLCTLEIWDTFSNIFPIPLKIIFVLIYFIPKSYTVLKNQLLRYAQLCTQ